jgi:hypothetical protein
MKKLIFMFSALLLSLIHSINCLADGSVSFSSDIDPILAGRPFFYGFIKRTFSVSDAGWGIRIDGPVMPHLGGARTGPYNFKAIWHGPDGDIPVILIINTAIKFFDDHHNEISGGDLREARSIEETLDSIEVDPQSTQGSVDSLGASGGAR